MNKTILYLLAALCATLFAACDDNDKPDYETYLPIDRQYAPKTKVLDWSATPPIVKEEIAALTAAAYTVNSVDDLPDTSLFDDDFNADDIDFTKYSLIITYRLTGYRPKSHTYGWGFKESSNSYNFYIHYLYNPDNNGLADNNVCLTRNAIMVKHIPSSAAVSAVYTEAVTAS